MSKKRLYEIAKELGKESKEVVARAKELGLMVSKTGLMISVKSAVSFKVIPSGLSTKILRIMSLPIFPYSISTSSKGASMTGSTTSLTNSTIVAIASTSS